MLQGVYNCACVAFARRGHEEDESTKYSLVCPPKRQLPVSNFHEALQWSSKGLSDGKQTTRYASIMLLLEAVDNRPQLCVHLHAQSIKIVFWHDLVPSDRCIPDYQTSISLPIMLRSWLAHTGAKLQEQNLTSCVKESLDPFELTKSRSSSGQYYIWTEKIQTCIVLCKPNEWQRFQRWIHGYICIYIGRSEELKENVRDIQKLTCSGSNPELNLGLNLTRNVTKYQQKYFLAEQHRNRRKASPSCAELWRLTKSVLESALGSPRKA